MAGTCKRDDHDSYMLNEANDDNDVDGVDGVDVDDVDGDDDMVTTVIRIVAM